MIPRNKRRTFARTSCAKPRPTGVQSNGSASLDRVRRQRDPAPISKPLSRCFARIFNDKSAMRLWFSEPHMYSASAHGGRLLRAVHGYRRCRDEDGWRIRVASGIDESDKKELTDKFSTMPPHAEVPAALRKLRAAGFRLFTLTDNLLEVQTRQLTMAASSTCSSGAFRRRRQAHKPSRQALWLCREGTRRCAIAVLPDRLPHLGHAGRGSPPAGRPL